MSDPSALRCAAQLEQPPALNKMAIFLIDSLEGTLKKLRILFIVNCHLLLPSATARDVGEVPPHVNGAYFQSVAFLLEEVMSPIWTYTFSL